VLQAAGLLLVIEIEQENGEGKRKRETEARTYVGGVRRWLRVRRSRHTASVAPPPREIRRHCWVRDLCALEWGILLACALWRAVG
jgi:hypothetical protein